MVWMSSDKNNQEKQALHYFATAFLINFIFGIISLIINYSLMGLAFIPKPAPTSYTQPNVPLLLFFPSLIISTVGTLIYIYYLWHGFDLIAKVIPETSMGKIGSILMISSLFIYPFFLPILGMLSNPPENIAFISIYISIMGILGVIALVGIILVVIALFKIGEHYNSTIIKVGAILFIFLGFIGAILLYIGFKDLEDKPFEKKSVILPPKPPW